MLYNKLSALGIFLLDNPDQSPILRTYTDTANDIIKSIGTGTPTFNNNLSIVRKDITNQSTAIAEVREIGSEIKFENTLRSKLMDTNKNYRLNTSYLASF